MGTRIVQRALNDTAAYPVDVIVKRGGVQVVMAERTRWMSMQGGVGLIAWDFIIPASIPSTGAWTFDVPILSEFPDQEFGHLFILGGVPKVVFLGTGVITTNAVILANQHITIRGLVSN